MKVTLIQPKWFKRGLTSLSFLNLPPMGLIRLAELTPTDWEVEIIDEKSQTIDFDKPADLVGITAMSALAPRAYEIAQEYRKRGITVIMGGIHASFMSEEAKTHVDCVVIGEAESIWAKILNDFQNNQLQPFYQSGPSSLEIEQTRYVSRTFEVKVLNGLPGIKAAYLQTRRGCPNNCNFCSVTAFNGSRIRTTKIDGLIAKIAQEIERNHIKRMIFADDNIVGDRNYSKELFSALKDLNVKWASQTDVTIADPDILDLALESGLAGVFLGLETISQKAAASVSSFKKHQAAKYPEKIRALRESGVATMGSFVFGLDNDNPDGRTIERTLEWAIQNKLDTIQCSILTPLPGTGLFNQMMADNRIKTLDWSRYNFHQCVYAPIGWTHEELEQGLSYAWKHFYSLPSIWKRQHTIPLSRDWFFYWFASISAQRFHI